MKQRLTVRTAPASRRISALAFATGCALALGGAVGVPAAAAELPVTIDVVTINDFHGRIEADGASAGAAVLAGAVSQVRTENPNTVFAAAGDLIGASTFTSFIDSDNPTIDALNAAGLDVSAAGNHEFDQGWEDLRDRVQDRADWEYISANVFVKDTGDTALAPFWTTEFEGVTVGFIGAVTEDLESLVSPEGIVDLEVRDIAESVNAAADVLTDGDAANGEADVILLLVHEGASTTTVDSITPTSPLGQIVYNVSDKVNAIVSAHTHLAYNHVIDGRPVVSAGQYGQNYGRMTIEVHPTTKKLLSIDNTVNALADRNADNTWTPLYPADQTVQDIVDAAVDNADVLGAVTVGTVTSDFLRAVKPGGAENRGGESTLGNYIADVHQWATGADIAVMNPGGIRTDILYGTDGTVTFRQAASVQPFANSLMTVDLTGAQVIRLLEQQWQPWNASRPYLKLGVSSNVFYTYDQTAPADAPVISQVLIDGAPIDEDAVYTVGANSFLATGGDSFTVFRDGTNPTDVGTADLQSMVDWFTEFTTASPDGAQRAVGISMTAAGPNGYVPGTEVTIDLSSLAFSQGAAVPVTASAVLDGVAVAMAQIDTTRAELDDETGTATLTFTVPDGLAGANDLLIAAGVTEFTVPFPIAEVEQPDNAALSINTDSVVAGGSVVLSGTGFEPGEALAFELHPFTVDLGTITVAADGTFTATVTIPAGTTTGEHEIVVVRADDSTLSVSITVTAAGVDPGGDGNGNGGSGNGNGNDPGALPATGSNPTLPFAIALMLLGAGGVLLTLRRRTHRA